MKRLNTRLPRRGGSAVKGGQHGFSLIEILVALVITAFGLLGLAGFITKATAMTTDASQRARAVTLLNDMAGRIASNKNIASTYPVAGALGAAVAECNGLAGAALDRCQWNNLLVGTQDATSGSQAAFLGFRGCITLLNATDPVYVVTVAWGSLTPGVPPADTCAQGDFGDDANRRVIRTQVHVPDLT